MSEPIRHHYIPQFILRNFAYDGNNGLHYFDVSTKSIVDVKTTDVFVQRDLYRDEINHVDNPTKLEQDFAKFEQEVSKIVKKCLGDNQVILTVEEYNALIVFFSLMGFRSYNTYSKTFNKVDGKDFYSFWQEDGNLSDFWRRNLEYLVNCRSIDEVINHPKIDEPVKEFFMRDSFGYSGKYIAIMERRGPKDFVISDSYPVVVTGEGDIPYLPVMPMFDYYPISPKRIIVFCSDGVDEAPLSVRMFENNNLKKPYLHKKTKQFEIKVTKIYENTVSEINEDIIKHAQSGFIITERNLDFYK